MLFWVILKIYIKEGQLVHVGDPLMYIGDPGEKLDEESVVATHQLQLFKPLKQQMKKKKNTKKSPQVTKDHLL